MSGDRPYLVKLDRVSCHAQARTILADISLLIRTGQHTAVCGPNGAGKSTLLKIMAGRVFSDKGPDGGVLWYEQGRPDSSVMTGRRLSGLVSAETQDIYLRGLFGLTGLELVLSGLSRRDEAFLYRRPDAAETEAARQAAAAMGAYDLLERDIQTLSRGQLRLLLLTRLALRRPALALLDEITDGLDRESRGRIMTALEALAETSTLVATAHRPEFLPANIRQTLYLQAGRLVGQEPGPPAARPAWSPARPGPTLPGRPLIELDKATVYLRGVAVLKDLDWTICAGENWILTGPNGSGKSTLLRLLAGYEHPALGGCIRYDLDGRGLGRPGLDKLRRAIHLVSDQLQATYGYDLEALELVLSGFDSSIGLYRGFTAQEQDAAALAMRRFGVAGLVGRNIRSLSTGELRRLFLARAAVGQPDLLLLDEPASGLDLDSRWRLYDYLDEFAAKGGQIVLATHHDEDIRPLINRRASLRAGRLTIEPG